MGGIPVALSLTPLPKIDTAARLNGQPRQTVAFPPCANELLGLIKSADGDEITKFFKEYFKFLPHRIFGQQLVNGNLKELEPLVEGNLDPDLFDCVDTDVITSQQSKSRYDTPPPPWPSECCICNPCVTLDGNRNPPPNPPFTTIPRVKRLFLGDVLWLFYFERMGIHQILGAILDAFAYTGRLPISNGSGRIQAGVRDDITALVLEVMVRQTKMGMSSTVRESQLALPEGARLEPTLGAGVQPRYRSQQELQRSLPQVHLQRARVLQGQTPGRRDPGHGRCLTPPSVATLITIRDTVDVMKRRFEPFDYGRNYYNALAGIVWTVAGMAVIRGAGGDARDSGRVRSRGRVHPPAAYDLLVLKRSSAQGDPNRFLLHRDCAQNGRDILLDLEVIDHTKAGSARSSNSG